MFNAPQLGHFLEASVRPSRFERMVQGHVSVAGPRRSRNLLLDGTYEHRPNRRTVRVPLPDGLRRRQVSRHLHMAVACSYDSCTLGEGNKNIFFNILECTSLKDFLAAELSFTSFLAYRRETTAFNRACKCSVARFRSRSTNWKLFAAAGFWCTLQALNAMWCFATGVTDERQRTASEILQELGWTSNETLASYATLNHAVSLAWAAYPTNY